MEESGNVDWDSFSESLSLAIPADATVVSESPETVMAARILSYVYDSTPSAPPAPVAIQRSKTKNLNCFSSGELHSRVLGSPFQSPLLDSTIVESPALAESQGETPEEPIKVVELETKFESPRRTSDAGPSSKLRVKTCTSMGMAITHVGNASGSTQSVDTDGPKSFQPILGLAKDIDGGPEDIRNKNVSPDPNNREHRLRKDTPRIDGATTFKRESHPSQHFVELVDLIHDQSNTIKADGTGGGTIHPAEKPDEPVALAGAKLEKRKRSLGLTTPSESEDASSFQPTKRVKKEKKTDNIHNFRNTPPLEEENTILLHLPRGPVYIKYTLLVDGTQSASILSSKESRAFAKAKPMVNLRTGRIVKHIQQEDRCSLTYSWRWNSGKETSFQEKLLTDEMLQHYWKERLRGKQRDRRIYYCVKPQPCRKCSLIDQLV
ncbi:hypothetical protein TWF281_002155 [Arthrobotrys megalospora]